VDTWQLSSWEKYKDVARLGRKTRLPEAQRKIAWEIFEVMQDSLKRAKLITSSGVFSALADALKGKNPPFDYMIVDECQDISVSQLKFFVVMGGKRPNSLFFAGDQGQRIFQQPFSWRSVGADIRGRSRTLKVNYRTSHQIRKQADRLLAPQSTDVDGEVQDRKDTISVFNGARPEIIKAKDPSDETKNVSNWIKERIAKGVLPHEIAVFVRSDREIGRAKSAVESASQPFTILDESVQTANGKVSISTMHLAKGLEFRSVVVMACDDEVIPTVDRVIEVGDDADLEEIFETERQLLYVACTRSRDHLLVSGVEPVSLFLDDMEMKG